MVLEGICCVFAWTVEPSLGVSFPVFPYRLRPYFLSAKQKDNRKQFASIPSHERRMFFSPKLINTNSVPVMICYLKAVNQCILSSCHKNSKV